MTYEVKPNMLITGDNLHVMHGMNDESVDLIYLDPPFNSKRTYSAPVGSKAAGASFKDMWTWKDVDSSYLEKIVEDYPYFVQFIRAISATHGTAMMSYITYMTQRLIEMHRILKPTGSLYLHVDPTASHYLKIVLDRVFGANNYRNEIAWCYKGAGRAKRFWVKKHDIIFLYSKSNNAFWANYKVPFTEDYLKQNFKQVDEDGRRCFRQKVKRKNKEYIYTWYPEDGALPNDWWTDCPVLIGTSKERTGFPTQKPLALLTRIIEASSKPNDIVLDPFAGCATTCVAAQQLGRRWIGIDIEGKAVDMVAERLGDDAGLFKDFIHTDTLPVRTDVKTVNLSDDRKSVKNWLGRQFGRKCNACNMDSWENLEVDHVIPKSRGGQDTRDNFQLLCGNCNRMKGNRPMEYLRMKIKQREDMQKAVSFGF